MRTRRNVPAYPWAEPIETLGDTFPGPLDQSELMEHPAMVQARADMAMPRWGWFVLAAVLCGVLVASHLWPMGFAPTL